MHVFTMTDSIFSTCQAPPPVGWVSVGEYEARFVAQPENSFSLHNSVHGLPKTIAVYPDITVECGEGGGHVTHESLFIPTQQYPWKKAWNTMWTSGLIAGLESLEEDTVEDEEGLITALALRVLHLYKRTKGFYENLWHEGKLSLVEVADTYSHIHDWEQSSVRAIALHPNLSYIAVGRQDDSIEVTAMLETDHRVFLRDKKQIGITCMEWAPHCNQLLAVGSVTCVLLWHIDPTAPSSRFVTTWVRVESSSGHSPVSSISWSPYGHFLVSSSPLDTNLVVWDVPMGVATKVQRSTGGGVTDVYWSPDGGKVFAGCRGALFRVWETLKWSCEKWTNNEGRVKAACWSPKGDMLVFALEGDLSLYYICFRGNELAAGSTSAIKCADLTPCTLSGGGSGTQCVVGGCVQDMCWDSTGERLAIIFTRESESADVVAVLRTRTSHLLDILPGGFIRGCEGEFPTTVSFKPGYTDGALLTTVWSSGRISFTPLCFQSPQSMFNYSPEQLTPLTSFQPTPLLTRHSLGGMATRGPTHTPLYSTQLDSD